jgi:hypothetical protein
MYLSGSEDQVYRFLSPAERPGFLWAWVGAPIAHPELEITSRMKACQRSFVLQDSAVDWPAELALIEPGRSWAGDADNPATRRNYSGGGPGSGPPAALQLGAVISGWVRQA